MFDFKIIGDEYWPIAVLCLLTIFAYFVSRATQFILGKFAKRAKWIENKHIFVTILSIFNKTFFWFLLAALFELGISFLNLDPGFTKILTPISSFLYIFSVSYGLYVAVDLVDVWLKKIASNSVSDLDDMLIPLVRKSLRVTIIVLALLQVATIISDKPLTSVLAGLGVGGLAVALAAQETIKNFFGSLVILGDKPFEIGDRVVIDGFDGSVIEVGFRSTRIRTLDGDLVTIPNGELANKIIRNIGQRPHIKRVLNLGLVYSTQPEKVAQAVQIVKSILENHEGMHPDFPPRVHFDDFNDSSLNINVIFWYHPAEYWDYKKFNELVCSKILEQFNTEGIEFAFPTQTLHISQA